MWIRAQYKYVWFKVSTRTLDKLFWRGTNFDQTFELNQQVLINLKQSFNKEFLQNQHLDQIFTRPFALQLWVLGRWRQLKKGTPSRNSLCHLPDEGFCNQDILLAGEHQQAESGKQHHCCGAGPGGQARQKQVVQLTAQFCTGSSSLPNCRHPSLQAACFMAGAFDALV